MLTGNVMLTRRSIVATEHPLASLAGLDALRRGGNAFDAAAAASFALCVVQPHLNGLGGDFFSLFYKSSEDRVYCLNSSGWAPASYTVAAMREQGHAKMPVHGAQSAVVPGHVMGVFKMQERFGTLEFRDVLTDAVRLADDGFPVTKGLSRALASVYPGLPESARQVFAPSGVTPAPGQILRQKGLAACLRTVAASGPKGFYEGAVADGVRRAMSTEALQVTESDLASFETEWCEPLSCDYRGTRVYEVPPNSMGATTLLMLRLMEERDLPRLKPNSAERISAIVEAGRVAYSARDAQLGDPRFVSFDFERFLKTGHGRRQVKIREGDTTYFAVADSEGNILSCIQSLYRHFGSRVMVDGFGFFLNDRASAFKFEGPNRLEPRKRPMHTLSALLTERGGRPSVALGCSGGDHRPQLHALLVSNMVDCSMDLEGAIGFPRFLWDGAATISVEDGYKGLDALRLKKERLGYPTRTGVAQGVELMDPARKGVCDIRGDGLPAGE